MGAHASQFASHPSRTEDSTLFRGRYARRMSYDIRVWGRKNADLRVCLPQERGWSEDAAGWMLVKRTWQIVVSAPSAVEGEDVPPEVAEALPGISTVVELQLQPISAPASARSSLRSTARAVAEALAGVIEDPQEDSLTLPRGTKRYPAARREKR